ncbi:MAG: glutathione synthase [Candidatus Caenarcaniphilales bacterium]|nr:glutathione synthase [Candidatus Caenarcaniphilales bacterium]
MRKHLFLTDSFSSLKSGHDSSLALMSSALEIGDQVWQAELKDLIYRPEGVLIRASEVAFSSDKDKRLITLDDDPINPAESPFLIWMRKDPPVDQAYLRACQLLRLIKSPSMVVNNPEALLFCDEKLFALEFPDLIPDTYIFSSVSEAKKFIQDSSETWIGKPIGSKAGEGIFGLRPDDQNLGSLLDILTSQSQEPFILQEYLPAIDQGDKRIFLWVGEPVGAVNRLAQKDDYRANMAAGGKVGKTEITPSDRKICECLKPRLLELGLYLVGLDVIGDRLTEINITSPTMLEEIKLLNQTDPAHEIIVSCHTLF